MATNMNRPKRMLVRVTLVTGTTVATLIGAQTLALMDRQSLLGTNNAANSNTPQPTLNSPLMPTTMSVSPTIEIQHVAPSITILRQPGQVVAQPASPQSSGNMPAQAAIQPPSPVQINAPAPIVVQQGSPVVIQQPSTATTQSTR